MTVAPAPTPSPDRPLVMFMHVPKTGGSSLRVALAGLFGPERSVGQEGRSLPRHRRGEIPCWERAGAWDDLLCCMGHYDARHPLVRSLPRERVVLASVLRDPTARAVSLYDYVRARPVHHLHGALRDVTFLDAVRGSDTFRSRVILAQLRYAFGTAEPDLAWSTASQRRFVLGRTGDLDGFVAAVAEVAGVAAPGRPVPHDNGAAVRAPLGRRAREQDGFEEAKAELDRLNRPEADFIAEHLAAPYVSPAARRLAGHLAARTARERRSATA